MTITCSCRFRAALVAAAALVCPPPAAALDPRKLLTQYGHDAWQVEDGLPQSNVKAIHQTRDGYLWLATEEGLARFDGVRFTVFDAASTPEMRVNAVNTLFEDEAGSLWIGTHGGGLLRYEGGRFTAYGVPDRPLLRVTGLAAGPPRGLWVGTGLGLLRTDGGPLALHPRSEELGVTGVIAMRTDRRGTLWMGTRTRGLVALSGDRIRRYTTAEGLAADHVWSLAESARGGLWVGTDKGLDHLAEDGTVTAVLAGEIVRALLEDRDGNLWVGTNDHGLKRLHAGRWLTLGTAEGLSAPSVVSLYEDREGSLWVGT
ncbi:MAG TPA: two-component regulator propeller domain-containing protein, partial [Vicinamibacteria bacterium]|nr:two-component regulator propeller domain-containing protein [Vicinamibacteria bacterium]